MAVATDLIDKSAFARGQLPVVSSVLDEFLRRGLLAMCGIVQLEILYGARNRPDNDEMRDRLASYEWLDTRDDDFH